MEVPRAFSVKAISDGKMIIEWFDTGALFELSGVELDVFGDLEPKVGDFYDVTSHEDSNGEVCALSSISSREPPSSDKVARRFLKVMHDQPEGPIDQARLREQLDQLLAES